MSAILNKGKPTKRCPNGSVTTSISPFHTNNVTITALTKTYRFHVWTMSVLRVRTEDNTVRGSGLDMYESNVKNDAQ